MYLTQSLKFVRYKEVCIVSDGLLCLAVEQRVDLSSGCVVGS